MSSDDNGGGPRQLTVTELQARCRAVEPLWQAVLTAPANIAGEGDFHGFVSDVRRVLVLYGVLDKPADDDEPGES